MVASAISQLNWFVTVKLELARYFCSHLAGLELAAVRRSFLIARCRPLPHPRRREHRFVLGPLSGGELRIAGELHGLRARVPDRVGAHVAHREREAALSL